VIIKLSRKLYLSGDEHEIMDQLRLETASYLEGLLRQNGGIDKYGKGTIDSYVNGEIINPLNGQVCDGLVEVVFEINVEKNGDDITRALGKNFRQLTVN
jgi:hypothetical protein